MGFAEHLSPEELADYDLYNNMMEAGLQWPAPEGDSDNETESPF